jgi:iron complex outermembrane receptor protein
MGSGSFQRRSCQLAAAIASVCAAGQVAAQQAGPAGGLEEVVVTATRRETAQQTTPVSVSAITQKDLERSFVHDIGQVAAYVPNFSAAKVTGFNAAGFAIRGTSLTDVIVYYEPPVAVIVDDFVLPNAQTQLLEPFDIEQIEVLRGPQGTLFGKNTTGGAVTVRTKRPELNEFGGEARLRFGNLGRQEYRVAANVPLGDTLALRVAGTHQKSDGYYKNGKCYGPGGVGGGSIICGDGATIGGDDAFHGRAKLLWQPNENLSALLTYEKLDDQGDTPPAVNETDPNSPLVFNLLGFPGVTSGDPLDQAGVTFRDDGLRLRDGHRINVDGLYLNINWDLGDYNLVSVTGNRRQQSRLPSTYAGEVFASLFDATRDDDRDTWQQEFRLSSDFEGPFNFVAGAFYQEEETKFQVLQYVGIFNLFGLTFPANFDTFDSFDDCIAAAALGQTCFDNTHAKLLANKQDQQAFAGFLDGTYELNEQWSVSAGVRYTKEEKDFFSRPGLPLAWFGGSYPVDANDLSAYPCSAMLPCDSISEEWSEPTYRLSFGFKQSDDVYWYALASRGFKSGGYNDQTGSSGQLSLASYDPEIADSYELGVKTELLDNRLRLNTTVFYVTYNDMQRSTVVAVPPADQETRTFNAGEVTAQGIEFEATAVIADVLGVRASVGYLDAQYDKFQIDTNDDGAIDLDLANRPVTRAPEWTAGLELALTTDLGSAGQLVTVAGVTYEDQSTFYYSEVSPQFDTFLNEKTLVNASLNWTSTSSTWFGSLYGRNLTDERYRTGSQAVGALWTFATYGEPRVYGVEVGARF